MKTLPLIYLLSLAQAAAAQSGCYQPSQPHCLTAYGTFEDEFSFDMCRRDMDGYRREIEDFSNCLANWVQETADDAQSQQDAAIEDYDRAVDYWNCKAADPEGYCSRP